jgi:hypothetical protein
MRALWNPHPKVEVYESLKPPLPEVPEEALATS